MRSPAALHSPSQTRTKRHRSSDSSAFCLRSVLLAPCQQQQVNSTSRTIRWFGTYLWPCESSPSPLKWTPHPPHPLPAALHSPSQTRTKRHLHANSPTSVTRPCIKHRRRAQLNPGRHRPSPRHIVRGLRTPGDSAAHLVRHRSAPHLRQQHPAPTTTNLSRPIRGRQTCIFKQPGR